MFTCGRKEPPPSAHRFNRIWDIADFGRIDIYRGLARALGLEPSYRRAQLWRFQISPCNVRAGNEKGRVENGVGYVKKNFLAGLELPDFAALAPAAQH